MSDDFGDEVEVINGKKWSWKDFKTTKDFPISDKLLDWVVGQDRALKECYLCLDEWTHKLKWLKKKKWWKIWEKPDTEKPMAKDQLPAGPYLLLLGDAGTGKSLIGKALAEKLTELYKKHDIDLYDVVSWKNPIIPSEPQITVHPAPKGKKLVIEQKKKEARKGLWKKWLLRALMGFLMGMGLLLIAIFFIIFTMIYDSSQNFLMNLIGMLTSSYGLPLLMAGGTMCFSGVFIWWISHMGLFGNSGAKGVGGAEATNAPKLLVDNSQENAPFIDATGHRSSQLFGDIAWDPYQTGDLGTPEHQRVTAGDIHRALMGILYIDEIKNLDTGEAITLLSALEDGQLPITMRSRWGEGGSAAMSVSTQPVPCFPRGTEVLTLSGYRPIEEIKVGDFLFRTEVTKTFERDYSGELMEIKPMYLLPIKVTPEHSILVGKKRWKGVPRTPYCEIVGWKEAKDITIKDYVVIPKNDNLLEINFEPKALLKLGGWYLAEGDIHQERSVRFTLNRSEMNYAKEIVNLCNKLGYKASFKDCPDLYSLVVTCNSKELAETLDGLFGKGAKNKHLPQSFLSWRKDDIMLLIDSLVKGDGNVGKQTRLKMASLKLLKQLQLGLLKVNILSGLRFVKITPTIIRGKQLKGGIYPELYWETNRQFKAFEDEKYWYLKVSKVSKENFDGKVHNLETKDNTYDVPFIVHNCMTFLIAAGNFDSIPRIHPALMDRIVGYGKVVRMNNDMPNTVENRRKYVQFIAQETSRFHLLPFTKEAVMEIINESRRRSGKSTALTTKFRPMISIIKTASTLAMNGGKDIVEPKYVLEAVSEHCKSIQAQLLEHMMEEQNKYKDIHPEALPKIGQVYGLAIMEDEWSGDMAGSVCALRASMVKRKKKQEGYFDVTGINKGGGLSGTATWVTDSVEKVRHVIIQKFGIDPAQDYLTHIDFAQESGVDGPSAGITMTLALYSILMNKKIRQDVAVTGEINIAVDGKVAITPIGGVYYKIKAAEKWGFKKVLVPKKNFEHNVVLSDYKIEVVGCESLEDYLREILAE